MKNPIALLALPLLAFLFVQCNDDDAVLSCACLAVYAPVCGADGVVYENACVAECAGVEYTDGFCAETHQALVLDLGDPALDGCSWVLELDLPDGREIFRPDTLRAALLVDSLPVLVDYKRTLATSACGLAAGIEKIEVLAVEAR